MNISQSNTEKQITLLVNLGVEFKAAVCVYVSVCVRKNSYWLALHVPIAPHQ